MANRFYPALLNYDDATASFGVIFPDFPGCVSMGSTVPECLAMAVEALALHVEGMTEEGMMIPEPSDPTAPLPDWVTGMNEPFSTVLLPVEMPGKTVRANITIDQGLLSRIDAAATAEGSNRSGWLAQAARERLRAH